MSVTHLFFLLLLWTTTGGNGLALGIQNMVRNTSFIVETYTWQEIRTHNAVSCSNLVASVKRKNLLRLWKKILISCPILFSFFFFLGVTTEGCVGKIYSYLEWIWGSEWDIVVVSNCPYSTRQRLHMAGKSENILAASNEFPEAIFHLASVWIEAGKGISFPPLLS